MPRSFIEHAPTALSPSPLLAEFERSIEVLLRHPGIGVLWLKEKRRLLLKRFPYSLIYTVVGEQLRISCRRS
jgi:hypothetical protein